MLVLLLQPANSFATGFSDADWATCPLDRKLVGGFCVYFGSSFVSWSSKKQQVVARSSTKSEYRALSQVACEVKWIRSLLAELSVPLSTTLILWCDNLSAAALACNLFSHTCTKHIDIDVHFISDQVLANQLDLCYVPSTDQLVDYFTKPLHISRYQYLRDKLDLSSTSTRLMGDVTRQSTSVPIACT